MGPSGSVVEDAAESTGSALSSSARRRRWTCSATLANRTPPLGRLPDRRGVANGRLVAFGRDVVVALPLSRATVPPQGTCPAVGLDLVREGEAEVPARTAIRSPRLHRVADE